MLGCSRHTKRRGPTPIGYNRSSQYQLWMGCGCGFQTSGQILPQRGFSRPLGWGCKKAASLCAGRTAAEMEPACSPPRWASAQQRTPTLKDTRSSALDARPCVPLTRSCNSRSCFPLKPPSPRSSSSSSWLAAAPPALGPCFTKNSSLWSSSSPCSIQAASCLYITPWHTAKILHIQKKQKDSWYQCSMIRKYKHPTDSMARAVMQDNAHLCTSTKRYFRNSSNGQLHHVQFYPHTVC